MYLLAQTFGILGMIITILQPQFRNKVHILICGIVDNILNGLYFFLLGQTGSSVFLCVVAVVQSGIAILHRVRKNEPRTWESVLFFLLYLGCGLWGMTNATGFEWGLTKQNARELLPVIGSLMFMLSVFAKGEQKTRFLLMLNGAFWLVYTALIGSTVFFGSLFATVSPILAMWKYRKHKAPAENG